MKKLILASILAGSAVAAQAADLTVSAGHNFDTTQNIAGIAFGTKLMGIGVEAAFDGTTSANNPFTRYSVGANYDVYKLWGATLTAKAAVAYVDQNEGSNGNALLVGASVGYPVAKGVQAVLNYQYQKGQSKISDLDGSTVTVGLKASF